jgi:hypothetical protein
MSDDTKETLLCITQTLLIVVTVVGLVLVFSIASWNSGYRNGWCEARGGVHISEDMCDVGGQVVHVERED